MTAFLRAIAARRAARKARWRAHAASFGAPQGVR